MRQLRHADIEIIHYFADLYFLRWWWWCYPTPCDGWRSGGTPLRSNSRATPKVWTRGQKWKK